MRPNQVRLIAEMLTDDPDIFCEGMADSAGMAGMASKPAGPSAPSAPGATDPNAVDVTDNRPLNATEINHQAQEIGGNEDGTEAVADQMKLQQDMQKQQELEKQKMLEPQMAQLQQTLQKLQTGVQQGKQQAMGGNEAFTGLDKEMTSLNALVGNLQKQI